MQGASKARMIYLPLNLWGREQRGLQRALGERYDLLTYDYMQAKQVRSTDVNAEVIKLAELFKPKVLHVQPYDWVLSPDMFGSVRRMGIRITQWYGDMRLEPQEYVVQMGLTAHRTLLVGRGKWLRAYRDLGVKCAYWPPGVDERDPVLDIARWPYRIIMVANFYPAESFPNAKARHQLASALSSQFYDFAVFGSGWPADVRNPGSVLYHEQLDCMASGDIVINFNNFSEIDGYFSARLLWALASGACVISDCFEGCDSLFEHRKEILYFSHLKEAVEMVEWATQHWHLASAIGRAGRQRVIAEHSWRIRVMEYADLLNRERRRDQDHEQGKT